MATQEQKARAEKAGLKLDDRWSSETIDKKLKEAEVVRDTDAPVEAITADAAAQMADKDDAGKRVANAEKAAAASASASPTVDAKVEQSGQAGFAEQDAKDVTVQQIEVSLIRDTWGEDGQRHRVGKIVHLPLDQALDAIEAGNAVRVKK